MAANARYIKAINFTSADVNAFFKAVNTNFMAVNVIFVTVNIFSNNPADSIFLYLPL